MRKKITLISAISCFLFVVVYTVMLSQQSLLVDTARQEFYNQKIIKQLQLLQSNVDTLSGEVKKISSLASVNEVFVQKSVSLEQFPNAIKNGVKTIRFTDEQGRVVYSTDSSHDFNRQISHNILEWAKKSENENAFFFVDRNHIISIQRYQNPYLMGTFGYIIVEISSSQLFHKLKLPHYFIRIIKNQPAVLILSDTQNINMELASVLAVKKDNIPPQYGKTFDVPMLGQVVYYMGEDFYVPPVMTVVSVLIFLLGLMLLRLFSSESKVKDDYSSKISQLIQDIEDGNNYNETQANDAINRASNFGVIRDLDVDNFDDIKELSDFSDIEEDEIEIAEFEEIDEEVDELSDFSDIEEDEIEIAEFEEIDEEVDELSDFSDIEEDEIEITEFEEIVDDKIIDSDEENEDILQQIIPLDDVDREVEEAFIPHYALGNFKNETVQKYMDNLYNVLEQYGVSNYAVAEEEENLYIFNGESFGTQFIIDKDDELYREVLSKGNALSLSGDLMHSEYLENLFSQEFLSEFTELYIRPIMEDEEVRGVVVLARDGEELSQDEKKDLLKNH